MVFATGDAILYAVLLFILFCFDLIVFYIIAVLNLQNHRDDYSGEIMGVNLQKYIKIVLIGISYGLVLITLNLMVAIATDLTDVQQFLGLVGFLFSAMLSLAWVWTIGIIIWIIYNIINDQSLVQDLNKMKEAANNSIR